MYFKICFFCFFILGILGFANFGRAHIINVSTAFDLLLVTSILVYKPKFADKKALFGFIGFFSYFIISLVIAISLKGSHLLDFLLAYKAIFYFALLFYFENKNIGGKRRFYQLYKWLVIFFFIKYSISILFSLNDRPLLFRENNFELMFLALLFYLRCILFEKIKGWEVLVIVVIFLISGSKSAIPILLLILASVYLKGVTWKRAFVFSILGLILLSFLSFLILSKYGISGLGKIDRIAFLRVFLVEMLSSTNLEILFGHMRITALMPSSCNSLYFYPGLFSFKGDGSCYSLILHSFILRSIFDHGVIGTLAIFYFCHFLLIRAGYSKRVAYTFLGVMFLNSLSVSAFNSVFFALSMLIYMGFSPVKVLNKREHS